MKLQVISDVHVDHWEQLHGPNWLDNTFLPCVQTNADVLVLAGDIVSLQSGHRTITACRQLRAFVKRYPNVVYVPGNHEYWGTSIERGEDEALELEGFLPGLHVLHPGRVVVIEGQRFLGATMFQPRARGPNEPIADHSFIKHFVHSAPRHFKAFEKHLRASLEEGDIVVTHHAPSNRSISPAFENDPSNRWFITPEVEPLILERKPRLFIHGHVHTPFDYQLGATRVICNPQGYPREGVTFDPHKVVEI